MKKSLLRISLAFAYYRDDELNTFAILVIACLTNNPLFPNLQIPIAVLTGLLTAYQGCRVTAAQGGPPDTAAKNEARLALVMALRQNAAYVQSLALTNLSDVLSSGYDVARPNGPSVPLLTPVVKGLDNSITTQLRLRMLAVANARGYEVQFCVGDGPWQEAGLFLRTKDIVLKNLVPGTVYSARVRCFGGSTCYTAWSAVVTAMSL